MRRIFDGVAGNNPSLNKFDLSYTNTTSMKFGLLYPVQCDEVYPADIVKLGAYVHVELTPLVAPIMSDIQMFAHSFFVPFRILYGVDKDDGQPIWEKFITGGKTGDYDTALPSWNPNWSVTGFSSGKIWDHIGNPVSYNSLTGTWTPIVPGGLLVSCAPRLAYNACYNAFYRDENLIDEVDLSNEDLLKVSFRKDYFTSALLYQQRGTAPAMPVDVVLGGSVPVSITGGTVSVSASGDWPVKFNGSSESSGTSLQHFGFVSSDGTSLSGQTSITALEVENGQYLASIRESSSGNTPYSRAPSSLTGKVTPASMSGSLTGASGTADLSAGSTTVSTFDVSDLRLAFAIQRMMELSMRAGYRYTEFLSATFGCSPTDARLDRPEYIGGALINITISSLTQNSGTQNADGTQETPQGNKVGIGSVDTIQKIGTYRVLEHGVIITLVSILPKPIYQQGVNRQWLRQDRFSFYDPSLAYLSEQGIFNAELWCDGTSGVGKDNDIFGYQAHWNELRCKQNMVTGAVREQYDYWTLSRKFASRPALNQDFIEVDDGDFNKIFAVQDEDPFIVSWSNLITGYRPLPAMGVPGRIDHVYGGY